MSHVETEVSLALRQGGKETASEAQTPAHSSDGLFDTSSCLFTTLFYISLGVWKKTKNKYNLLMSLFCILEGVLLALQSFC